MKKFLQSIFRGKVPEDSAATPASSELPTESTGADESLELDGVIADLKEFIRSTIPDPISLDEIDPMMHLYDAGYVTSITAADLLAHIETRYGLDVSETQLIGRLQNLDALARHIISPNP